MPATNPRKATRKERVAEINRWFDEGLRGAKIFLTPDVHAGLEELEALQVGCPRMKHWMVDFLWMLDEESAERASATVSGSLRRLTGQVSP